MWLFLTCERTVPHGFACGCFTLVNADKVVLQGKKACNLFNARSTL